MLEKITYSGWGLLNPDRPALGWLVEVETVQDHIWWHTNPHLTEASARLLCTKLKAGMLLDPTDGMWHLHGHVSAYLFCSMKKAS